MKLTLRNKKILPVKPNKKREKDLGNFKCSFITKLLIIGFCLISFKNQGISQAPSRYPLKTNEIEIGFTMGTILLAAEVELSVTLIRRVSDRVVLEAKPLIGFFGVTYNFSENENDNEFIYSGGTIGINLGNGNHLFELTVGAAHFNRIDSPRNLVLPLGTIGYKIVGATSILRIGLGYPYGFCVGLNF